MITAYVGVGSNIERRRHIEAGVQALSLMGSDLRFSTIYECPAQGFDSHPFFNLVVELKTSLSLDDFQHCLREVEFRWGRAVDAKKCQDRTLDMDIILFGDVISPSSPVVPRPDIYQYPFVIQPLYELCPELQIPGTDQSIKKVWQSAALLEQLKPVPLWFCVK